MYSKVKSYEYVLNEDKDNHIYIHVFKLSFFLFLTEHTAVRSLNIYYFHSYNIFFILCEFIDRKLNIRLYMYSTIFFFFFAYNIQTVKRKAIRDVYTLFYDDRKGFEER